ncbi:MAG: hypothetical protein WKG00_35410 [Polyangiaceae bacterium]
MVWGRLVPRGDTDSGARAVGARARRTVTRAAPITLARRRDLALLMAREATDAGAPSGPRLSPLAEGLRAELQSGGAAFLDELVAVGASLGAAPGDVEDALWELVAAGCVSGDGFAGLRALLERSAPPSSTVARIGRWRRASASLATGRWALLRAPSPARRDAATPTSEVTRTPLEAKAMQYLRRYGVVFRDLLAREPDAPPWRDLLGVYRRLETRGDLRGGRLCSGFVGEQFALPEALDALRAVRRQPSKGEVVRLSACDPLNLVGVLTSGPGRRRVPANLGNEVVYRDGIALGGGEAPSGDLSPEEAAAELAG